MSEVYALASFKNSRVSTRQATTTAAVSKVSIPVGVNTLIAPANTNRTYLTIRNENITANDDLRYDYFDNPDILSTGFLLKAGEAVDLENMSDVFGQAVTNALTLSVDEGSG